MSLAQQAVAELTSTEDFFTRSTRNLQEAHSTFAPVAGMMTAAQQVAHAAHTVDWFIEGAFGPDGFSMDFAGHATVINGYTSLKAAQEWFTKAMASAKALLAAKSDAELLVLLPPGPIMGGAPRLAIVSAIVDHTAHHRGALTVYARLNGVVPPMPYMET